MIRPCCNREMTMEENNTPEVEVKSEIETEINAEIETVIDTNVEEIEQAIASEDSEEDAFSLDLDFFDPLQQEDKLWQARTGLDEDSLCGAIETIIFMSDRPVGLQKIKNLIDEDIPLRVVHDALTRLQEGYEASHHGLRLVEVADGYQYRTKATYSKYVQDLFKVNSLVLSPTALEVLAIIAYKQPIARTEVDKIRGVDSSHIVRGLMDKRLVKVNGRSDEMGRPTLYGTTPEFLEVFNLADLSQLPPEHELEELSGQGKKEISDIKSIVALGDKDSFHFDEMDELELLSEEIKSISIDTAFTKSLKSEEKKRGVETEQVRSAFDLLEEFITTQAISDENKVSLESEPMTNIIDPKIIKDLRDGPFNTPEEDDNDEFVMIDLDTGEPIEEAVEEVVGEELIKEDDRDELEAALDQAFAVLTGETSALEEEAPSLTDLAQELELNQSKLDSEVENIDKLTDEIVSKGSEIDLDLSFLQGDSKEIDS
ncbi:MAG: SMC-Scp complex subunit ScpB [Halobacteriovoraceae bacterium]|jgi:segregation and condensation protein B|nr:SMC-Scp complex subunit ScpB [Halobacteriovoraceae bacterium]MBT5096104.1 SMC-Scp complex subunit ScpB [Halobacteriovoraceae bacterium]